MPIANYNLESTYNCSQNYGSWGGYNRPNKDFLFNLCKDSKLQEIVNPRPAQTILMVGVGFGWIAEKWTQQGLGPICAVDTSTWIHSQKHTHAAIPIYNYDVNNAQHQLQIKQVLGLSPTQKIDICITEDCFTGLTDQECVSISASLNAIGKRVIHYITPPAADPNYDTTIFPGNKKTAEGWKAMLPNDSIIMRYIGTFIP
jgi:hypothetical protein